MPIISLQVSDSMLEALQSIQDELGFAARSEVVRSAVRQFITDRETRTEMKGKVEAVVIVIHGEDAAQVVDEIRHEHYQLIKTQVHHHLKKHRCMDIFVIRGGSKRVNHFVDSLCRAEEVAHTKTFFL